MDGSTNSLPLEQDSIGIQLSSDNFSAGTVRRYKIAPHTWLYQFVDLKAKSTGDFTIDTLPEAVQGYGGRAPLIYPEITGRVTGVVYVLSNSPNIVVRCLEANVWMVGQMIVTTF